MTFRHSGAEHFGAHVKKVEKGGLDQYSAERFNRLIFPQSEKVWH